MQAVNDLTPLEREVVQKFLEGNDDILSTLREQLRSVVVTKREMTGVGFYTAFAVSHGVRRGTSNRSFVIGDVCAKLPGLDYGAGFLLYVQDGVLHMLEGHTYDERWPTEINRFELDYTTGRPREMEAVRKIVQGGKPTEQKIWTCGTD